MTDYQPREGDRVLVTHPDLPEGGMTGRVTQYETGWWVKLDDLSDSFVESFDTIQLLHRPVPPRPEVESFTRSDGAHVDWLKRTRRPLVGRVITPEDADLYATMYGQVAEQMRWDAEYGSQP